MDSIVLLENTGTKPMLVNLAVVILLNIMGSVLRRLDGVNVFLSLLEKIAINVLLATLTHQYANHANVTLMELSEINALQLTTSVHVRITSLVIIVRNVLLDTQTSLLDVLLVAVMKQGQQIQTATKKQDSVNVRGTLEENPVTLVTRVSSTILFASSVIVTLVVLKVKCVISRVANVCASPDFLENVAISVMRTTTAILIVSLVFVIMLDPNQLRVIQRLVNAHVTITLLAEHVINAQQDSTSTQVVYHVIVSPLDLRV